VIESDQNATQAESNAAIDHSRIAAVVDVGEFCAGPSVGRDEAWEVYCAKPFLADWNGRQLHP
jgi:hypothetical protein